MPVTFKTRSSDCSPAGTSGIPVGRIPCRILRHSRRVRVQTSQVALVGRNDPLRLHLPEEGVAPHGLRVGGAEHLFQDLEDVEAAEATEAVLAATNGQPAEPAGGGGR